MIGSMTMIMYGQANLNTDLIFDFISISSLFMQTPPQMFPLGSGTAVNVPLPVISA